MKLALYGELEEILEGAHLLQKKLGIEITSDGTPVRVRRMNNAEQGLTVSLSKGEGEIVYSERVTFFRGLGLFVEHVKDKEEFHLEEHQQFDTIGPMFDLSRNAVMKVETFKEMFQTLALMGFNATMLYMEDVYEIKSQPYFGYMRGRYSQEELKELDDYAYRFGIEIIPCIQTLAHLEEFLKWSTTAHLKDTRGVLLVENEATYDLIEDMIQTLRQSFRSHRIHIGMDEAEELGRGVYLNKYGYKDRLLLMTEHMTRVLKITQQYGFEPIMWSDMFLKLASKTGESHYDLTTEIPQEMIDVTPENVTMMYWNYAHTNKDDYVSMLRKHKDFGKQPAFAGGVWVWNTFAPNYNISLRASQAALEACKEEGIHDIFVTLWGDDGFENNYYTALLGLQMYAEHAYSKELDQEKLKERVKFCTGMEAEHYLLLNQLDTPPGVEEGNVEQTNPSKFLLWQDVLLGLFDKHVEGLDLANYYTNLEWRIKQIRNVELTLDYIFEVPEKLAAVLALKATIGVQLKAAYDTGDIKELERIATNVLPEILNEVEALRAAHRIQWLRMHKPFGWEVIDIRYGGLKNRLDTAIYRIQAYINGQTDRIEELEEERLYYHDITTSSGLGWSSYYYRIASPNVFFHVLPI
ncbi:beta-N-acetylhexosaminidase [Virgibacillus dokdonensis]|uniref:Beta-N-acetylhexosaminidase n=1 Tax=Virgibacillus dokdonensis TaxID=302167 RepID=A0A2K9IV93_9BACI|nr:beta-N-acetylhexosaminidase [Virgibacillus dokdonensis]AUJ23667.1 Glycosyl hydrolase family 20, catalytic domain [Virgibacillus dokdonensis]